MEIAQHHCVNQKMQIKTTMQIHFTPTRMAKLKRPTTPNVGEDLEYLELRHCCWGCKMVQPLWKTIWQFLITLNTDLLYDSPIPFPTMYPREMKTYSQKKKQHKKLVQKCSQQ